MLRVTKSLIGSNGKPQPGESPRMMTEMPESKMWRQASKPSVEPLKSSTRPPEARRDAAGDGRVVVWVVGRLLQAPGETGDGRPGGGQAEEERPAVVAPGER